MNKLNVISECVGIVLRIEVGREIKGSGSWVGYEGSCFLVLFVFVFLFLVLGVRDEGMIM